MTPVERDAFLGVAQSCRRDVDLFCDTSPLFIMDMGLPVDPFMQDFGRFMDSLMDTALMMPMIVDLVPIQDQKEARSNVPIEPEEIAALHVVSQLAVQTHPDDDQKMTDRIVQHGTDILEQEDVTADKRRMARRLTEVSPQDMHEHRRAFLPFGCPQRNRCLQEVYDHRAVSFACGDDMAHLENVRASQYEQRVHQVQEENNLLFQLSIWYMLAIGTMVVLYIRRRTDVNANRRMKILVLKAIYSKPELKAAVEQELGESIGHIPPLSMRSLITFGLHGKIFRQWIKAARMVRLAIMSLLMGIMLVAPSFFLPVCIGLSGWLFFSVVFAEKSVRMCACCCCSATTEDAKNGTLTEEQACCGCCQGTGVCCAACADCCDGGGDSPGPCNCCTDGCNCCSNGTTGTCSMEGGCCCCCGGDGSGCADGCTCCCSGGGEKGAGDCCATQSTVVTMGDGCTCSCCASGSCPGDCSCCDTCPCGTTTKKIKKKVVIYEGVPMQVV